MARGPRASPRPGPTRPCSTCPGPSRWRTGPRTDSPPCPRGISRHIVRFVKRLRPGPRHQGDQGRPGPPRVRTCCATSNGSTCPASSRSASSAAAPTADGEPLDACLLTRHLQFSLPYRALFSQTLRPDTAQRLIDALAVLLVRLHLAGFCWGDVSLSNTLFRRDAGAFAAYLVDAETGELHATAQRRPARARPRDRPGQHRRRADGPRGRRLPRGGRRPDRDRPNASSTRYRDALGRAHRAASGSSTGDRWRVERARSGGSTSSASTSTSWPSRPTSTARRSRSSPRSSTPATTRAGCCASPGSTSRRTRPAGCSTTSTRTAPRTDRQNDDEEIVAHEWLARVYEPVDPRGPARPAPASSSRPRCSTRCSSTAGTCPSGPATTSRSRTRSATTSTTVLPAKPDEKAVLGVDTVEMPVVAMFDD